MGNGKIKGTTHILVVKYLNKLPVIIKFVVEPKLMTCRTLITAMLEYIYGTPYEKGRSKKMGWGSKHIHLKPFPYRDFNGRNTGLIMVFQGNGCVEKVNKKMFFFDSLFRNGWGNIFLTGSKE